MKCKKFDEKWFANKLKQYKNMPTSPEKKKQRLDSLKKLAQEKNIKLEGVAL